MKSLVVNLCDLGDVLLSTPLVQALGRDHAVHYLVDASCAGVIAGHASLERCWVLPRRDWRRRLADPQERSAALGEALAWAEELKDQRFNTVYSLQPQPLAVALAHLSGATALRGFRRCADGSLGVSPEGQALRRHLQHFEARGDDGLHAAEGYLTLLPEALRPAQARLSCTVAPGVLAWVQAGPQLPGPGQGPCLAVLPGAGEAAKRWSPAQWRALLRAWHRCQPDGRAWVLGGPEDGVRGGQLAAGLPWVRDLCGQLSLEQSAAVLMHCDLALGGDTGPMHLAAAVGTPCLALFGGTHPAESGPLLKGSLALQPSSRCLDDLPAGTVLRALLQMTQGRGWRRRAGVSLWAGREAEGRRVDAACRWAAAPAWMERQGKVDGQLPLNALADAASDKAERGQAALEGPALALELAVECAKVKVLWEERP